MGTTNDEAYLCLKALASSVRRNKSSILPLIRHVIHNLQRKTKKRIQECAYRKFSLHELHVDKLINDCLWKKK